MAFTWTNLTRIGGGNGFGLWHYKTTDTHATVNTAAYFNNASYVLNKGDVIFLHCTSGGTPEFGIACVKDHAGGGGAVDIADMVDLIGTDTD